MRCKHNWVRSGHGNDLICTKCGYAAMQATLTAPNSSPVRQPILREKREVPLCIGDKTVRVSVYKDELEKELQKYMGLNIMQMGG